MEIIKYADLIVELDNYVASVTLNRPHRKNALRAETITELIHALEAAEKSAEVRCVVLTGAGGFFCSGGDLKGGAAEADNESPLPVDTGGFPKLSLLLDKMEKPVVAKVAGAALAGGMGLMMMCHFSLAASDAEFGTPEIKRALWPMMIMRPIFSCMPKKKAIEMILTGRKIKADEAESLGAITRAVPANDLDQEVSDLAALLASYSPVIMRLGLGAMGEQFQMSSEEAFPYLEGKLKECAQTEDFLEGIMAFAEKRKPVWKGK